MNFKTHDAWTRSVTMLCMNPICGFIWSYILKYTVFPLNSCKEKSQITALGNIYIHPKHLAIIIYV